MSDEARGYRYQAEHPVTGKNAQGQPTYDDKVLVLTSPHVSQPVQFRYAWGRKWCLSIP